MLAISTKFVGPTNHRSSRIIASVMESAHNGERVRKLTLQCEDAMSIDALHRAAVVALAQKLGWTAENGYGDWIVGSTERGIVAVCDTKHGYDRITINDSIKKAS